jgi:D-glycero-alpha-D-manno-heptose 1-phosphate guanylyltransferase
LPEKWKQDPDGFNKSMMSNEAIILAGGLGTRLRDTVPDLPKCMAPVAGRPFLFYVINYLRSQGLERFIFSLGYKHEVIEQWLAEQFPTLDYQCVIEEEPLGTGGAISMACRAVKDENVVVANGDTIFRSDISRLISFHLDKDADCTLTLKPMKDFDRYGVVELDENNAIKNFKEKQFYSSGLINGGIYVLNVRKFLSENLPAKFSFEKDYLEKLYPSRKFFGVVDDGYFIDIGVPTDYVRAQLELQPGALDIGAIDKSWTLFIDRDGVINHEKKEEYIRNWDEFRFYEGVEEAMKIFGDKFGKVIVISNQRGVGRQLMTEEDLSNIHRNMQSAIEKVGGRIDHIYYCTSTDNKHICRKPNPGMAFLAKKDFPGTDFSRSIMIGNKPSDMLFGRFAGIHTVFVKTTNPDQAFPHPDIDLVFESLADFAKAL